MCLIWGATWIAMKAALAEIPPALFAGTRFLAAGALLLAYHAARGTARVDWRRDGLRLAEVTMFMVVLTYPLLFWGALYVTSGLAAVIDLSFLPVALLAFGVAVGEERFDRGKALSMAVGVSGLAILLGPKALAEHAGSSLELWGAGAIVLSAVSYAAGSVMARPLLRTYPAVLVSGLTLLGGGLVTTAGSVLFEPGALEALPLRWTAGVWGAWLFLVLGGSIAAYTFYLRLVRDWGPSRAGAYCFVSPAIAVVLGQIVYGEPVGAVEVSGMVFMLAAAWLSIRESPKANRASCEASAGGSGDALPSPVVSPRRRA